MHPCVGLPRVCCSARPRTSANRAASAVVCQRSGGSMMRAGGMIFAAAVLCAIAAHAQPQARVTIVALGASNTEGWGVSAAEAYPAKLQVQLNARGIDAAVI